MDATTKKTYHRNPHHRTRNTTRSQRRMTVIGVGNVFRRDDGIGCYVARELRTRAMQGVRVLEMSGEGTALLEAWKGAEVVWVCDAVTSGAPIATIHRLDTRERTVPANFFHYSSHAFGLAEAVELARVLNQLPKQLIIYGVECRNFDEGPGLSSDVEAVALKVVDRIAEEVCAFATQHADV